MCSTKYSGYLTRKSLPKLSGKYRGILNYNESASTCRSSDGESSTQTITISSPKDKAGIQLTTNYGATTEVINTEESELTAIVRSTSTFKTGGTPCDSIDTYLLSREAHGVIDMTRLIQLKCGSTDCLVVFSGDVVAF